LKTIHRLRAATGAPQRDSAWLEPGREKTASVADAIPKQRRQLQRSRNTTNEPISKKSDDFWGKDGKTPEIQFDTWRE